MEPHSKRRYRNQPTIPSPLHSGASNTMHIPMFLQKTATKRHRKLCVRPGFTLIEVILYIALSGIVFAIALHSMMQMMEAKQRSQASTTVQQSLRIALNRMIDTSLNATSINDESSNFGSAQGSLSFAMSDAALNPTVFSVSQGRIIIQEGASMAQPITAPSIRVDLLRFTNVTPPEKSPVIRIEMHATQSGSLAVGSSQEMTIDTSLSLRR